MTSTRRSSCLARLAGFTLLIALLLSPLSCPLAGYGPANTYAFYYPSYGEGLAHPWPPIESLESSPLLGAYDSRDPEVLRKHIQWARRTYIGGFIGSDIRQFIIAYRGWDDPSSQVVKEFLDVANEEDAGVSGVIMIEKPSGSRWQPYQRIDFADQEYWDALVWEIGQILENYATRRYYNNRFGKPTIVIRAQWNKDSMAELQKADYDLHFGRLKERVAQEYGKEISLWGVDMVDSDAWDVYTEYNPYIRMEDFDPESPRVWTYTKTQPGRSELKVASVIPGFAPQGPGTQLPGRRIPVSAKLYNNLMRQAFASRSEIIFVTTWNGWFEGTAIEPSVPPLGLIEPRIKD